MKLQEFDTATKLTIENFKIGYQKALENRYNTKEKRNFRFDVVGEDGKIYSLSSKSLRYELFNKNTRCAHCGLEGEYFLLQRSPHQNSLYFHANLYALDNEGKEHLLTKDHIIRKRDGGKDHINNLQTLCRTCNFIKN